jgi:hypothetical protein
MILNSIEKAGCDLRDVLQVLVINVLEAACCSESRFLKAEHVRKRRL